MTIARESMHLKLTISESQVTLYVRGIRRVTSFERPDHVPVEEWLTFWQGQKGDQHEEQE